MPGKKRKREQKAEHLRQEILKANSHDEDKQKRREENILSSLTPAPFRAPKPPKTFEEKQTKRRLIVILEHAPLETIKSGQEYYLMNSDEHFQLMAKNKLDPADYRPDIVHQTLLTLFDSPLNKAGLLEVYIHTQKNVLIAISPHTRLPRTFNRFSGLMVQLLHKMKIRATNGPDRLLTVVKNPITDHLPVGCRRIAAEHTDNLVNIHDYVKTLPEGEPVAFVVGAMPHGNLNVDYVEDTISFSQYPLSAAAACGRLCSAFELLWGVN